MERVTDRVALERAPVGRCVASRSWLYFYPTPDLCGFAIWGHVTLEDMRGLVDVIAVGLEQSPHGVLVDVRRLDAVDGDAFAALQAYVRASAPRLARSVSRTAIVRSATLGGALATGFFGVEAPPYPVAIHDDPFQALEWLGVRDADTILADVEHHQALARERPTPADGLRCYLEEHVGDATLDGAARALGTSRRTLQRRLRAQRTAFHAELDAARIRIAKRLLATTDAKLLAIAFEVGCASVSSFAALFRRVEGVSPSVFRAARDASSRAAAA